MIFSGILKSIGITIMAIASTAAMAEWRVAEGEHFNVFGDTDAETLQEKARELEAFHWLLLKITNNEDDKEARKVNIYLVPRIYDVGQLAAGAAGFYGVKHGEAFAVGPIKDSHYDRDFTSDMVLKHEYAHHFMLQYYSTAYHPWYVEGWAELVATSKIDDKNKISFGLPAKHRGYELSSIEWIPTKYLFTASPSEVRPNLRWRFYGQAWLMAHYLTFSKKRAPELAEYLNAITKGDDFEKALDAFKPSTIALDNEARDYLKKKEFKYIWFDLPEKFNEKIPVRTLSTAEDDLMRLKLRSFKYRSPGQKKSFARDVENDSKDHADHPFAMTLLFNAQIDAKEFADADKTASRLLAAKPDDSFANYAKSQALIGLASKAEGEEKIRLANQARKFAIKSNRADPNNHLPLIAFYDSHVVQDKPVPAISTDGLVQSHLRLPQDFPLRMKLATHLHNIGRSQEAKTTLMPLIWSPHDKKMKAAAKKLLAQIEGNTGTTRNAGEKSVTASE